MKSFQESRAYYLERYPSSPFFETWIPEEKFIGAEFDEVGNFTISREDDGVYGIALGPSPVIPTNWKNFSMESKGVAALPEEFKVVAEWDCYWAPTVSGKPSVDSASDSEIKDFLEAHAPQSSVFPGNDEIQRWVVIRDNDEIVAVAALCRWESGRLVISSVATHSDRRGKGFGRRVMEATLIAGYELGAKELSLGVMHSNESAQRLYASTGFTLMHNFSYCERR